jgi:hypothetical protein
MTVEWIYAHEGKYSISWKKQEYKDGHTKQEKEESNIRKAQEMIQAAGL